jgi:hypothetical protein
MKGQSAVIEHLKDVPYQRRALMAIEFIFAPYHVVIISIVMVLTFITSPAILDISFQVLLDIFQIFLKVLTALLQVDFIVFCTGLIFPLTICIGLTQQRKDAAVNNLATIKTELRALRTMFMLFSKDFEADGKPPVATKADTILSNLAENVQLICRNDQSKQVVTTLWLCSDYRISMNGVAHYISDGIVDISNLLRECERQFPIYNQQKEAWSVRKSFSQMVDLYFFSRKFLEARVEHRQ